jgi:nuclear pore complex protein Nup205
MEPYVDFIIGTVFSNTTAKNLPRNLAVNTEREETVSEKLSRVQYRRFRPALQLSCLQFMHACLANFNDDLLDMAHKGIPVDDGIRTSSLLAYAKLHPFGRVMEHILTEKCLNVLFEILQLGWEDLLEKSEPSIAVTDTILYTIMILDLAIELQPTYFRVVRPFIKQDEGIRRSNVVGNSFDKLEKAINYHLDTVVHLGLYVGATQPDIVLSAIKLLQKFNVSPDMMASTESTFGRQLPMNRVLGVVEQSTESRKIVLNFIEKWELSEDLEGTGNQFSFKMPILKFLDNILAAHPNDYNLAHMLLGFGYDLKEGIQLSLASGGIGSGVSLLHCIMLAALDTRETADGVQYSPPHCEFKNTCFRVLSRLWHSPATSSDVLFILRANKFLFEGFLSETTINSSTLWSNTSVAMSEEFFDRGASAFCDYLQRRTALFEYTALEIRQLTVQGASTMVQRYLSTLLGTTVLPDRGPAANVHILDLLDFLEFHFEETTRAPHVDWLPEVSSSLLVFQDENPSKISLFDLRKVAEFLKIKKNSLLKSGTLTLEQESLMDNEIANLQQHLFCENQLRQCLSARLECLRAWAILVIMMLEDCDMEHKAKTAFVLQALQAILPKLEAFSGGDVEAAEVLSALAHCLISHVTFDTATFGKGRGSDLANDRLYQLFRISLRCIQIPLASPRLREDFYNIALKYLNGMAALNVSNPGTKRHDTQTIKASGDRLLEVACNDAYAGDGPRKVVSLLLLEAIAALAAEDGSSYVVDTVVRHNFLVVLVDSIMSIGSDLQNTSAEGELFS